MKRLLAAGSVERRYIEELRIPGGPNRDGRPSDELTYQIIRSASCHLPVACALM